MFGEARTFTVLDFVRAVDFAARKHRDHRRMGKHKEPYINHPIEVAALVAAAGASIKVIVAAVLHDTLEDTETTSAELELEFGEEVAHLVLEVSDDKKLPKATRKQLQIEHAPGLSHKAAMIKLADKTSNIRSLATDPPRGWDRQQQGEYLEWAKAVVDGCRHNANENAGRAFDAAYKDGVAALDAAAERRT